MGCRLGTSGTLRMVDSKLEGNQVPENFTQLSSQPHQAWTADFPAFM